MVLLVSFTCIGYFYTLQDTILLFITVVCKTLYLTCYGYMMGQVMATLFGDSYCQTLVTSSSHFCLCMEHVALLQGILYTSPL